GTHRRVVGLRAGSYPPNDIMVEVISVEPLFCTAGKPVDQHHTKAETCGLDTQIIIRGEQFHPWLFW
ncbi:hypothetical protein, partial [Sulfitobacter sp. HI0027]|uniref:hypothetical protein n=1 Tax=Sulfitobacter sp. HI0027 TaxID=1822226 RepID=UPI001F178FF8